MIDERIRPGWDVHDAEGAKIGSIEGAGREHLHVTGGLLRLTDLYIPASAIARVDPAGRRVDLDVSKDRVESLGWTVPPAGAEYEPALAGGPGQTPTKGDLAAPATSLDMVRGQPGDAGPVDARAPADPDEGGVGFGDGRPRERGAEVAGGAAGAVGGMFIGGAVAGPAGAVVGAVVGAAGGDMAGRAAEAEDGGTPGARAPAGDEDPSAGRSPHPDEID